MEQLSIKLLILLGINQFMAQECSVRTNNSIHYPTPTEIYTVDLYGIF